MSSHGIHSPIGRLVDHKIHRPLHMMRPSIAFAFVIWAWSNAAVLRSPRAFTLGLPNLDAQPRELLTDRVSSAKIATHARLLSVDQLVKDELVGRLSVGLRRRRRTLGSRTTRCVHASTPVHTIRTPIIVPAIVIPPLIVPTIIVPLVPPPVVVSSVVISSILVGSSRWHIVPSAPSISAITIVIIPAVITAEVPLWQPAAVIFVIARPASVLVLIARPPSVIVLFAPPVGSHG
mmetsp:Transcript_83709/g.167164  ORF Transcript_83709/g.167164 Transcript_83709/m.167164 type:complete len:234 (+) Transcript_83709:417-1118(+)